MKTSYKLQRVGYESLQQYAIFERLNSILNDRVAKSVNFRAHSNTNWKVARVIGRMKRLIKESQKDLI